MPQNESKELLEALDAMKAEKNKENAERLTKLLEDTEVFVPAVLPQDTDPGILKQMYGSQGTPQPVPEGARPVPCILQNEAGQKFFPIFTSNGQIEMGEGFQKYPITLNMPFKSCLDFIVRAQGIDGAVINPFSHNIIMNINKEEEPPVNEEEPKQVQVSEQEFHTLVRRQMESYLLPGKIFTEGEEFIKDLCSRKGECLLEFFKEPYAQVKCPYEADDYDFMTLNISDTLQLTRISMPHENLYPGIAETLFVTWNPESKKAGYYGILKAPRGEFNKLMEITSEGKAIDHGDAPGEGSELQGIIDIANAKNSSN
ncbi:MAG: SseB family protein [Lachnospiraceae bacterium]